MVRNILLVSVTNELRIGLRKAIRRQASRTLVSSSSNRLLCGVGGGLDLFDSGHSRSAQHAVTMRITTGYMRSLFVSRHRHQRSIYTAMRASRPIPHRLTKSLKGASSRETLSMAIENARSNKMSSGLTTSASSSAGWGHRGRVDSHGRERASSLIEGIRHKKFYAFHSPTVRASGARRRSTSASPLPGDATPQGTGTRGRGVANSAWVWQIDRPWLSGRQIQGTAISGLSRTTTLVTNIGPRKAGSSPRRKTRKSATDGSASPAGEALSPQPRSREPT